MNAAPDILFNHDALHQFLVIHPSIPEFLHPGQRLRVKLLADILMLRRITQVLHFTRVILMVI
jgi:hypothetical protein